MQVIELKNLEELIKYKDLIDTIIEGLNYVNSKLKIGEFDKSIVIFSEMITGINAVMSGLGDKLNTKLQEMKERKDKLDEYLELLVTNYEQGEPERIILNIDTKLIPFMKDMQNYCYYTQTSSSG